MKKVEIDKKDIIGQINRLKSIIAYLESLLTEEDLKEVQNE